MLNIIVAPFVLVLWAGSGRSITIPQNSLAICEQNKGRYDDVQHDYSPRAVPDKARGE